MYYSKYNLGDTLIFSHLPGAEWVVAEIKEKYYIFVDLWTSERWASFKKSPIHSDLPERWYRGGRLLSLDEIRNES